MPEQTALILERILSLSSAPAPGPSRASNHNAADAPENGGCSDQALLSSMFYEVVDDHQGAAVPGRTRFDSNGGMSWTQENNYPDNYNDHVLEHQNLNEDDDQNAPAGDESPYSAHHGPDTYGEPHMDPYGPIDRAEAGPSAPPDNHPSPSSPLSLWVEDWESGESHEKSFACTGASKDHPHDVRTCRCKQCSSWDGPPAASSDQQRMERFQAGRSHVLGDTKAGPGPGPGPGLSRDPSQRQQQQQTALSQFIPQWAYETLPRDCLIMLLQSALKHMPEEADVVALCMRALNPLAPGEYHLCFGRGPSQRNDSASATCDLVAGSSSGGAAMGFARSSVMPSFGAARSSAHESAAPGAASMKVAAMALAPVQWQPKQVVVESHRSAGKALKLEVERSSSPGNAGSDKRSPPLMAAGGAGAGAASTAEVRRTISKGGNRTTSIRLTDSRAGTRTSILTGMSDFQDVPP